MSLKFYCLVIHTSHKRLEIGCAWSKGSGERHQGHHGPLFLTNISGGNRGAKALEFIPNKELMAEDDPTVSVTIK